MKHDGEKSRSASYRTYFLLGVHHIPGQLLAQLATMPKRTRSLDSGSEVEANATDSTQPLVQEPGDAAGKRPNLASTDTDSTSVAPASPVISCSLALHKLPIPFYTYEDYDNHYHATHMNRCPECGRNFPLAHYLALHIEENHDAFFETRKGRGEKMVSTYYVLDWQWMTC